jgi:hypothetical protein
MSTASELQFERWVAGSIRVCAVGILMNTKAVNGLAMMAVSMLAACSSVQVKRSAYEAVYQKSCMDQTGVTNCDPEHMTYDEYRKDRERVLESESQ